MGTGTALWCSPVSALLHHRSQRSVVTVWPGAHALLPGALQALQLSMLSARPRCVCPRAPGLVDVPRVHVATLPRAGSGHRLGGRRGAGCEQEAASCLPTSSLSPSQPRCGSPEPAASAERSAVAGGVFITPAGGSAFRTSALRAAALPPRLRRCKGGGRAAALELWFSGCFGDFARLTLHGGALRSLFPSGCAEAGSCTLQQHCVRSLGAGGSALGPHLLHGLQGAPATRKGLQQARTTPAEPKPGGLDSVSS